MWNVELDKGKWGEVELDNGKWGKIQLDKGKWGRELVRNDARAQYELVNQFSRMAGYGISGRHIYIPTGIKLQVIRNIF